MAKITSYILEYYAYQVVPLKFLLASKFEISEIPFLICFKIWDVTAVTSSSPEADDLNGIRSRGSLDPASNSGGEDPVDDKFGVT
jgi:hypothetical protein